MRRDQFDFGRLLQLSFSRLQFGLHPAARYIELFLHLGSLIFQVPCALSLHLDSAAHESQSIRAVGCLFQFCLVLLPHIALLVHHALQLFSVKGLLLCQLLLHAQLRLLELSSGISAFADRTRIDAPVPATELPLLRLLGPPAASPQLNAQEIASGSSLTAQPATVCQCWLEGVETPLRSLPRPHRLAWCQHRGSADLAILDPRYGSHLGAQVSDAVSGGVNLDRRAARSLHVGQHGLSQQQLPAGLFLLAAPRLRLAAAVAIPARRIGAVQAQMQGRGQVP